VRLPLLGEVPRLREVRGGNSSVMTGAQFARILIAVNFIAFFAWCALFCWVVFDGCWVPFLKWVQRRLGPVRCIFDRPGREPYLSRSYFWATPKLPDGSWPFDATGQPLAGIIWRDVPVSAHLHQIHQSDTEQELHSHPWKWAYSLILSGGYIEERRHADGTVRVRRVRPGQIVRLLADDYHRLDLIGGRECWSLFVAGPKTKTWHFWNRETGETVEWREFIKRRRA
jgi:hypothetical protein